MPTYKSTAAAHMVRPAALPARRKTYSSRRRTVPLQLSWQLLQSIPFQTALDTHCYTGRRLPSSISSPDFPRSFSWRKAAVSSQWTRPDSCMRLFSKDVVYDEANSSGLTLRKLSSRFEDNVTMRKSAITLQGWRSVANLTSNIHN